jgi:hypothetical protein
MDTTAIVAAVPFARQGLKIDAGSTLIVPVAEAAALIGQGWAIPAGAMLERSCRPVRGTFKAPPRRPL